jgi:hypothetical protein
MELARLLEMIAEELDITDAQYAKAEEHYQAVGGWLDEEDSSLHPYSPKVYAQGSMALGTVVKPVGQDEFDIDLVCELGIDASRTPPAMVFEMVGKRLKQNGQYDGKLTRKNRCWRLDYAEPFHMDIIPAVPDVRRGGTDLQVPDRELAAWKETNPRGYVAWFGDRTRPYIIRHPTILAEAGMTVRAEVAPLPDVLHRAKTPLQRAVQLLKRQRDIRFNGDDGRPVSIVITTLGGHAYEGEDNVFDALTGLVVRMEAKLDREPDGHPACYNPVNRGENFGDKWRKHPERLAKLITWLCELRSALAGLPALQGGLPQIGERAKLLFGDRPVERALSRLGEELQRQRAAGTLRMAGSGLLGVVGTAVRGNTFYGER